LHFLALRTKDGEVRSDQTEKTHSVFPSEQVKNKTKSRKLEGKKYSLGKNILRGKN